MLRPSAPPIRRLSPRQMAFVRSWAEGLDVVSSWNRYLPAEGEADARRARGELQRLLDQLRGLARSAGRQDIAALLLRDPEAMVERAPSGPTLEEFAAQQPEDYYSEAELLELFQEQHGRPDARSTGRRRQRLRERLGAALVWLEQTPTRVPTPDDPLEAWLDARVVARLKAVALQTLGDLLGWINAHRNHWHRQIPRLGPVGAERIMQWLREHEASLGDPLATAAAPSSTVTGIVPLERFIAPATAMPTAQLSCRISARTDVEAVRAWVALKPPGSHTARAYRKEAERFLLWTTLLRGRALAALGAEDLAAYAAFLRAPPPDWTAPRHTPRDSPAWRPFEGPLSPRSIQTALTIVRGLCGWLTRMRYLTSNPWDELASPRMTPPVAPRTLVIGSASPPSNLGFSEEEWGRVLTSLSQQQGDAAIARLTFLMRFGAASGLQLSEWPRARLSWIELDSDGSGNSRWILRIPTTPRGRAADDITPSTRQVPLDLAAVEALRESLRARGLSSDVFANPPETPLITRLAGEGTLTAARIYEVLRSGFQDCARALAATDPALSQRLASASVRSLRHTYARALARLRPPAETLRERLGHQTAWSAWRYLDHPG